MSSLFLLAISLGTDRTKIIASNSSSIAVHLFVA
jgi:hypothetical protein